MTPITKINELGLTVFGDDVRQFWIGDTQRLLERFPLFEFPFRQLFYTIVLIEKAEGEIITDGRLIKVDAPKIIFLKPNTVNQIKINRYAKGKILCFTEDFFSLRYNNNVLYQFSFLKQGSVPYTRINEETFSKVNLLLEYMTSEFLVKQTSFMGVLRSYLNIVLQSLERLYIPNEVKRDFDLRMEKIVQLDQLIDKHYLTNKLPSQYAEMMHLTTNYLNKICKDLTGSTTGELIRKRIIIEAQRLLHYTSYNVNEIAEKLGFENTSYFVTFFKRETQQTPEMFRKRIE